MSYQQNGKIEATDINTTLAGDASPAAASTTLNAIWGTGSGDRGYGQTPYVSNVVPDSKITAAAWGSLVTTTSTINNHQGLTLPVTPIQPTQNALINYDSGYIQTNINAINTNRLFAKLQGVGTTNTTVNNTVWNDNLTFTFTVTFPTANQARYFFNAGGQLSLNFLHPAGSAVGSRAVNLMFSQLCTASGTIVMSAMNTGSASIGGGNFTGITKLGGSGTPVSIDLNKGYYGLSPAYQTIFKQKSTAVVPGYYADSFIEIKARTNGSTGSNGDNGNVIYIQVLMDQVPNGAATSSGTTVYLTATPPAQAGVIPGAFLPVKSWELPTITSTVAPISGASLSGPIIPAPTTPAPTTPTFTLTRSSSFALEGGSFTITLTTNQAGSFPYTITGITSADIGGTSLTGSLSNGSVRTFNVTADFAAEGPETFTLSLNNGQASVSVSLSDTSVPTYTFSDPAGATTQAPSSTRSFTVATQGVPDGTVLYWQEIGAYGFVGTNQVYTSGSVTINNNSGTFNVTLSGTSSSLPLGSYFIRMYTASNYSIGSMVDDSPEITLV
jgi:hypothetical protein